MEQFLCVLSSFRLLDVLLFIVVLTVILLFIGGRLDSKLFCLSILILILMAGSTFLFLVMMLYVQQSVILVRALTPSFFLLVDILTVLAMVIMESLSI